MRFYKWTPAPKIGSFLQMVNFKGSPMLQSAPMLDNGDREEAYCDVSRSAFDSEADLGKYSRYVASVFNCTTQTAVNSIRG